MKFEIGEVAIGQNYKISRQYNGMECEIIKDLHCETVDWEDGTTTHSLVYRAEWADGRTFPVEPQYLRKRPNRNTLTTWDECFWKPEGVKA